MRGFATAPGTLTLSGPTPFGSGILNASISNGATIASTALSLAASPSFGAEFGYATGGGSPTYGNVATLILLNNGTTKQCVQVKSNTAPTTVGPTAGVVTFTAGQITGINTTTYQAAFSTGSTTVSFIPAEFITTGSTTFLSAADAPPAHGGSCNRYTVACTGLPNVSVDIAESTHPTAPVGIVLKIGAEVQPYAWQSSYDFENSSLNIVQNIVSSAGGMNSILLEAIFPGGNAWNSNTGLTIGHPKGVVHLASRYMAVISWVYNQYCLTTGSNYPSGASGNLPLTVWGGSGSCAGIMLCCQYYGLGWRKDVYPTKIMLDSPGAGILTYREMSGLSGDNTYNPVVAAGSSAAGMQTVAEGLLDDQPASFPPSQGGNYNPTTLQPLGGLGDGQGPSYQSLFTSGWGPSGAYHASVGALTVHTGAGFTISSSTSPATFTADGTATGWPGSSSAARDVNGIVTVPLNGGGSVLCSYYSITTGSPNTFNGCTWSGTGTVNSGASLVCGGTAQGYIAAAANLANQADGPFALPGSAMAPNSLTRYLRFVEGSNDTSNLPILINTWLPNSNLSASKYLWHVVPGAAHDIASSATGAAMLEAELFDQPTIMQNISQSYPGSGTAASPVLPGWTVNGTNPHSIQNNAGTILFAVVWGSNTNIPSAPVTTQSPASGIHSWTRVPAGQAAATYTVPVGTAGADGIVTVFTKVATGLEVAADFAWPVPTSGSIYAIVVGEAGIGLDNPVQNTNIVVVDGAGSHNSGFSGYGIDVCGAAAGVGVTTLTANNNTPTGSAREVAICFVATTIGADLTRPLSPSNGYSASNLNNTASYASTGSAKPDGTNVGALGIAMKNVTSSSTTNFTITSSGSANIGAGYFVLKGSVAR